MGSHRVGHDWRDLAAAAAAVSCGGVEICFYKDTDVKEITTSLGSAGKEAACNARDLGLIPGLGRSPGEGKGYPLHYYGLENSMDCIGLQRVRHD